MNVVSTGQVAESTEGEAQPAESGAPVRALLVCIQEDGLLVVSTEAGQRLLCDWLDSPANQGVRLLPGDPLLVARAKEAGFGVVLGRIGRYRDPALAEPVAHLRLEATETVTLACGEASIDLRADGKVMVRGEDVLLRAKGTQRIRAGTVSIN